MIMNELKQSLDKHDENVEPITTGQPYGSSAGTSTGTGLAGENGLPLRIKSMLIQQAEA